MKTHWHILAVLCVVSLSRAVDFQGGSGTSDDPYQIGTAQQLIDMGSDPNLMDKCFVLVNDIDLDPNLPGGRVFDRAVIAPDIDDERSYFQGTPFSGRLDGQGFQIRNLHIEGQDYLGLCGHCAPQATLVNLSLVLGEIKGRDTIGGLVGKNQGQIITSDCYMLIQGQHDTGGLVGFNDAGMLAACHSDSTVSGVSFMGGLVGNNDHGHIVSSYSTGKIRALLPVEVPLKYNGNYVGGLVGRNDYGHVVSSYSTGEIEGRERVGGLAGYNSGYVWASYSTGAVEGYKYVGGLVGGNSGTVTSCYSTGKVSGQEIQYIGGLTGSGGDLDVFASFWDTQTSGMATSHGGTGLTTAEMMDSETYLHAGWDFTDETDNGTSDYWSIVDSGCPRLTTFISETAFPVGSGTQKDPYRISDAHDLGAIWHRPLAYYQLESDIDLSDIAWGMAVVPGFGGHFDGRHFRIHSLIIDGGDSLGLFGNVTAGAEVRNMNMSEVAIYGIGAAASLAGTNAGLILDSSATGTVRCPERGWAGGLVGVNTGLIGACDSAVSVTGKGVGGIVADNSGLLWACTNSGTVTGHLGVGGLAGSNSGWPGDIVAAIWSCRNVGTVQGTTDVGGLVGSNDKGVILSCESHGDVHGESGYVGGLVGSNRRGNIASSYSLGSVSGRISVGGLVGNNQGRVEFSYSAGAVNGERDTGGLVGRGAGDGTVTASYWDLETSGMTISAGGTGLDTAAMMEIDTYLDTGWDFTDEMNNGASDYWEDIAGSYPSLTHDADHVPVELNGSGTQEDPYQIAAVQELGAIWYRPHAHYRLTMDLDLTGITWGLPVVPWFGGTLDGAGFAIHSLAIEGSNSLGLIGLLQNGCVTRLGLQDMIVAGTGDTIGGLVGYVSIYSTVSFSSCEGSVSGREQVGGLVGDNHGTVESCHTHGMVTGETMVGGLVGYNFGRRLTASCSTATVKGNQSVGGLVGANRSHLASCYSQGTVQGTRIAGGLVGHNDGGSITSSYSIGPVDADQDTGGFVGMQSGGDSIDSFWDIQTSSQTESSGGLGLNTVKMQDSNTFLDAGWDFMAETENGTEDIWWIEEGKDYPRLWWELISGE